MPNEAQLRSRWGDVFHDSEEYQSALRSDAYNRLNRDNNAEDAIRYAMRNGDTGRAAAIQQELQLARMREDRGETGRAAGLDRYQNQRATDYINSATQRGRALAQAQRSDPLSGVTNGPGYYASLENPDFATHFPYDRTRGYAGHPGWGRGGFPQSATPPPTEVDPQVDRMKAIDAYNHTLSTTRREQHLRASLPKPLLDAYMKKYQSPGGATPKERNDFLWMPPEKQWAELHGAVPAARTPGSGGMATGPGGTPSDYLGVTKNIGSGGSIAMPTISPVGTGRATASLATPPDVLKDADKTGGDSDDSFANWRPD